MKMLLGFCLILICTNLYGYGYVKDLLYYQEDTLIIHQISLDSNFVQFLKAESINYNDGSHMKCFDGYRVWELRNDSLFLKKLLNCNGDEMLNKDSSSIFYEEYGNNEVFACWVNCKVYNQYGKLIERVSDYFIYEFDREFKVKEGKLEQVIYYDNRASRTSIYYSEVDSLYVYLYRFLNWKLIEKYKCDLDNTVIINFNVNNERKPEDLKILRGINENCDSEIVKAVSKIPEWNLYYMRGKPIEIRWYLPVKLRKIITLEK